MGCRKATATAQNATSCGRLEVITASVATAAAFGWTTTANSSTSNEDIALNFRFVSWSSNYYSYRHSWSLWILFKVWEYIDAPLMSGVSANWIISTTCDACSGDSFSLYTVRACLCMCQEESFAKRMMLILNIIVVVVIHNTPHTLSSHILTHTSRCRSHNDLVQHATWPGPRQQP